jgi:endoglucanase
MDSRARWTAAITRACQDNAFSSAYWEFGAGFGAYDRRTGQWRKPLLEALVGLD